MTLALLVLVSSSLFVLQFESRSPDANITTGGDALWWSAVTITTVGYGDCFPVTTLGRLTGLFVMLAGVGIIGRLASILASLLVSPGHAKEPGNGGVGIEVNESATGLATPTADAALSIPHGIDSDLARAFAELAQTREEMAEPRRLMAGFSVPGPPGGALAPEN